jgi:hypothetical protein
MGLKLPPSGGLLPRPILDLTIRREDEHLFTELHIDIDDGKQKGSVIVSDRRNSGHAALDAAFSNNS